MNKYNVFTIISLIGTKTKVFVSERSSPTQKIPKLREVLRNLTYKHATGVITQTHSSKDFIEKETGNANVCVIPNPIKEVKLQEGIIREKIILSVGRLVEAKGQKYLLEAFSKLQNPGWRLVLAGDGPLRQSLESLAADLKITSSVVFVGQVKDVDSWLNKASIFAFPSLREGFPNALAEAMSAGLPCVSFDCETGPSELISDGVNGYLVDLKDVDDFTKKLQLLADDEALRARLGTEAQKVREKLSTEKIADDFLNFCLSKPQDRVHY